MVRSRNCYKFGMNPVLLESLSHQWQQLLEPFEVDPAVATTAFTQLVEAYTSPHRHYHTLEHIAHVLTTLQPFRLQLQDPAAVQFAAWFHDVVYDPQASYNEANSAIYAEKLLQRLGIPEATVQRTQQLILSTQHHQSSREDWDSQVFLDADLAILGTDAATYQAYVKAIRQEYDWLPTVTFCQGRRQVLEQFLQRPRIYFTAELYATHEAAARRNLAQEVQALMLDLSG